MTEREEWIAERAAILEFDGGLTREDADTEAKRLWTKYQRTRKQHDRARPQTQHRTD